MKKTPKNKLLQKFYECLPYVFLAFFAIAFFHKLFFPLSLFSTPGDILYFNYPLKNFLAESLKAHQLPVWTNLIGTGFPVLADGPIGAFYLPNVILSLVFPSPVAFNLTYVIIFLTASIGIYLLCRTYNLSRISSLYAAVAFGYSGFFIARIIHTSFIQVVSLLPLSIFFLEKFITTKHKIYLLFLSFLTSQMIFAGYPQGVLYIIVFQTLYLFLREKTLKSSFSQISRTTGYFTLSICFGVLLSAIQIIPSFEMLTYSARSSGLGLNQLFTNSGSFKSLLLFFDPFAFGNLTKGNYNGAGIGFYWENIAYSGILTPFLAALSIFNKKSRKIVFVLIILFAISLILSLGRYGPLHIIFSFPPFNFFRIPARFLFLTSFFLCVLSSFTLNTSSNAKWKFVKIAIPLAALLIISLDIVKNWYDFNQYTDVGEFERLKEKTEILRSKAGNQSRVSSLWPYVQLPTDPKAWGETNSSYVSEITNLMPDSNMIFNIPSSDFYTSLSTRRLNLIRTIYGTGIKKEDNNTVKIEKNALNLMRLQAVKYIVYPYEIENSDIEKTNEITLEETNLYTIKDAMPRIRVVKEYKIANSASDLIKFLADENFDYQNTAIFEKEPPALKQKATEYEIHNIQDRQNSLSFDVTADGDGYLLISDTYYPGWNAYVNTQKTEIFAVNANARALYIPEGNNKIEFKYQPKSFLYGFYLTIFSYGIFIFLILNRKKFFKTPR